VSARAELLLATEAHLRAIAVVAGCSSEDEIAQFVANATHDLAMAELGLCPDCAVGPIDLRWEDRDGRRWLTFEHGCGWALEMVPQRSDKSAAEVEAELTARRLRDLASRSEGTS